MATLEVTEYVRTPPIYGGQTGLLRGQDNGTQSIAIGAASVASAAFAATTNLIEVVPIGADCRVAVGASASVAAANSGTPTRRLRAGQSYRFAVEPGQAIAAIAMEASADAGGSVAQVAPSAAFWSYAPIVGGIVNTVTAVTIKAASGAGVRNHISGLQVDFDALGAATELAIRDGAAGTVLWRMKIPAGVAGQREITFPVPLRGTANTLLEVVTLTASVTGGVFVNAQGYTGA